MHSCRRRRKSSAVAAPHSAQRPTLRCVRSVWACLARSPYSTAEPSTTPSGPRLRSAATCSQSRSSRERITSIPICPRGTRSPSTNARSRCAGSLDITADGGRRVGLTRIHLEEDAGKSLHEGFPDSDRSTYIDFNRSGVPLIEIVTEPDMRSAAQAADFFERLRDILVWIGVNDGNMEEGSLRCDGNVSVRPVGQEAFGVKTEVKNVNSFRYIEKALEYEIDRQIDRARSGRPCRAGNALVRFVDGAYVFDAQQGRGARLPVFSGARLVAARRRRSQSGGRAPNAAGAA